MSVALKSKITRVEGRRKFYLLQGPPYVTANLHVGNARNYIYQDIFARYLILRGYDLFFIPGLDCHGLPIEVKVESMLKFRSKKDILEFGVEKFVEKCKEWALQNGKKIIEICREGGLLHGLFNENEWYWTLKDDYIEKVWWAFKKIWEKGLVYKGARVYLWCPRCETVLSSGYETSEYKDLSDWSIYVKFPVKEEKNTYLLVWTTTPWTLPANVAVAVHPEEKYVKVRCGEEHYVIAEKRLCILEKLGKKYEIVEKFKGEELKDLEYLPVIDTEEQRKINHRIILSIPLLKGWRGRKIEEKKKELEVEEIYEHLVNIEEGTGLVHIATAHGEEDFKIGEYYKLPILNVVDVDGKMVNAGKYNGLYYREANERIIEDLENKNFIFYKERIVHRYPICWRCKTPLIFRLSEQWFVAIEKIKDKLVKYAGRIKFYPEYRKEQFINWLLDAKDWVISRQRFWGIPIPIWICNKCGKAIAIGSKEELEKLSGTKVKELHIPWVNVKIKCDCGGTMERIPDVFDVWMDSACAPFAAVPADVWEKIKFVDWICEAQDQIRGWFYSMHVVGSIVFDRNVYESVLVGGWVLDWAGRKMSKSLGNVIYWKDAINKIGKEAIRFYVAYSSPPSQQMNFNLEEGKKVFTQFSNVYRNVVRFYVDYSRRESSLRTEKRLLEDSIIENLFEKLKKEITEYLENCEFDKYARRLRDFILEDLSRFYIKVIRERIKKGDISPLKILGNILKELVILTYPLCPELSDELSSKLEIGNIIEKEWPSYKRFDGSIIEAYEKIKEISSAILSAREKLGIRWRWPLKEVSFDEKIQKEIGEQGMELICRFCNIEKFSIGVNDGYLRVETSFGCVYVSKEFSKELAIISEFCRGVQSLRKELSLKVFEKANLIVECDDEFYSLIKKYDTYIKERCNLQEIKRGSGKKRLKLPLIEKEIGIWIEK